jgi:hypothetical protein
MSDFIFALLRVINLPYFWASMALVFIMAMFTGGLIYNGEVPHAKKGAVTVGSYIFMILLVMVQYINHWYSNVSLTVRYQLFIYPIQLGLLSIFWFMGFVWAIFVVRCCRKRRDL